MKDVRILLGLLALAAVSIAGTAAAQPSIASAAACPPPPAHCPAADCPAALFANPGEAVDPATGRKFFLDYPCDLKPGEKVVFILNLHGAGSIGNWERHYFPAVDYVQKYRLVVATPTAATGSPVRMWLPDADDVHLQNITRLVFDRFGKQNIKAFWLAGHSQGGMSSNRLVCSEFFKDKADGWLSLSGGRIGPAGLSPLFVLPPTLPGGSAGGPPGGRPGVGVAPSCDISYIFETGQMEIAALPETSPWADKYACAARTRRPDVVDDQPGYVYDTSRQGASNPAWGGKPRPGTAEVMVYPGCKGGRLVADVVRLGKGHTEGLEPKVTEALIQLIVAAPGGKAQGG